MLLGSHARTKLYSESALDSETSLQKLFVVFRNVVSCFRDYVCRTQKTCLLYSETISKTESII